MAAHGTGGSATPSAERGSQAFERLDWGLLVGVALLWGSSFLLIGIGVDHFRPGVVAWLRLLFGALALGLIPASRGPLARSDWPAVALLGVVWMAVPFVLFPVAEQWIDSSLAGMVNGSAPLFTALVATAFFRRLPGRRQLIGLSIGFLGVLAITAPAFDDAEATGLGVTLVLLATLLYGVAINLAGPLQRRNGALPVIWRAQLVALVLDTPVGLAQLPGSSFAWSSLLAVVALGALGTGLAFVWMSTLIGRVGSTRASVTVYFLPAVAIALGAGFRDEQITVAAVIGTLLVVAGAYLTSRRERPVAQPA